MALKKTIKEKDIDKYLVKLDDISKQAMKVKNYKRALSSMSVSAELQYLYNQEYVDEEIEKRLQQIAEKYIPPKKNKYNCSKENSNIILFYDGFGKDIRGLAYIYLKAIIENKYEIIYVTIAEKEMQQPTIMKLLKNNNSKIVYVPHLLGYVKRIKKLLDVLQEVSYKSAFFYAPPQDVSAVVAFNAMKKQIKRYQINLTDHAFWLGVNAFDYCLEFRNYGASISHYYRGIKLNKLLELPYYPFIEKDVPFKGFPFEIKEKKIIFSGGDLYKTIDTELKFYAIVDYILNKHNDTVFYYAGNGDCTYLDKLSIKYPKRVAFSGERNDFYQILENSYLYLNSYPISGGLMLQYAAKANCIPISLKREWDGDARGILLGEEDLDIFFTDYDTLCLEIDKLLEDRKYWENKKNKFKNCVISPEKFKRNLKEYIENPKPSYNVELPKEDTTKFRKEYKENLQMNDVKNHIASKSNIVLFQYFPGLFIRKFFVKILIKLIKKQ